MTPAWKNGALGLGAAAIGALVAVAAMQGLGRSRGPDPAATGAIVRSYILDHPDILPEAMDRLHRRETAALVAANRAAIETPFAGAVGGNPKGDVTLVEYFDYACGYCRQSVKDVDRLAASDTGLRIVYKELPILSEWSEQAARLSLGAAKAGRFGDYHHALYAEKPSAGTALALAGKLGVDPAAATTAPDIGREIDTNLQMARALRISGTPTFVVGDQVLSGAVGYDALRQAVAETRAGRAGAS
ncbi:MAG TPA: DsbA family protein [Sphingomonas sp.]